MFSSNASSAAGDANYIEDVFSTWLYNGNSSTQTITNGIDLAGEGGLVWAKGRSYAQAGGAHVLTDTVRGAGNTLYSELTAAQDYDLSRLSAFTASGFSLGNSARINESAQTYVSWTFRKQPKFFDVVTYTGDGQTFRTVNHNLGAMPGFIICKCTSTTSDWSVLAKMSSGSSDFIPLNLNSTASSRYGGGLTAAVSSTLFYTADLGFDGASNDQLRYNQNGATYVAYLFAHNAGGFGLSGTDNVISCGSYTGNGSTTGPTVTLGYEPQWLLVKKATGGAGYDWCVFDNMRGLPVGGNASVLFPNSSIAETTITSAFALSATGFNIRTDSAYLNESGTTYIYMAIRRGPMKVPTTGASVFTPANASGSSVTTNFPVDMFIKTKKTAGSERFVGTRLFGPSLVLQTQSAVAEISSGTTSWDNNTALVTTLESSFTCASWIFQRAPGFMDVVCYTGTGSARTVAHNLAAVPELIILKARNTAYEWKVWSKSLGVDQALALNTSAAPDTNSAYWNSTVPTASVFSLGSAALTNLNSGTFVAYLFATCPGVSKVGSYTGTAAAQTINCGFTGGARFVLIKRTDSTGDWYVWDSARGIVSGDDPYLLLNSTAAEVTNTDYIDTFSAGFEISSTAPAAINANGGTFVFLAIA